MSNTCSATKYPSGSYRGFKCQNTAKVERDGKHYCGIHDPVAIKEKAQARNAEFEAAYEERRTREKAEAAAKAEQKRRADCYEELLEALKDAHPHIEGQELRKRIGGVIIKASGGAA